MESTPKQATFAGFCTAFSDPASQAQFFKFAVVGTIGFLADTAIVYALRGACGLYVAGLISYGIVATLNWALNRAWTFRGASGGRAHVQWARYLVLNLIGLVINRGTYAALIASFALARAQPVFAVAAGAVAGMMINFIASKKFVFI
jgi:putative flippase GtrA